MADPLEDMLSQTATTPVNLTPPAQVDTTGTVPTVNVTAKGPVPQSAQPAMPNLQPTFGPTLEDMLSSTMRAQQLQQIQQAMPQHPVAGPTGNLTTDVPRFLGTAGTNALGGMLGLPAGVGRLIDWPFKSMGVNPGIEGAITSVPTPGQPNTPLFPSPEQAKEMAYQTTGATEYQPSSLGGRLGLAGTTAGLSGGVSGLRAVLPTALGGVAAQGASEAFPNSNLAPLAAFLAGQKVAARGLNLTLPPAGGSLSPETAQLAQTARNYDIPLAPGQITGNPFTRYLYSETSKLPFSGSDNFAANQQSSFNRAVAGTFGEDASKITPDVLQTARDRIGGVFDGVAQRTSIPMTQPFMAKLQGVVSDARMVSSADSMPAIQQQGANILRTAYNNGGDIGGSAYQSLTKRGGPIDSMIQSSNGDIRNAGMKYRAILDDELAANAAPKDISDLQTARQQWKALKTVEPLTVRADALGGARPTEGDISPAALRASVNQSYPNAPLAAPNAIPLNDLAKVGQRFLKEPADSGTPSRLAAQHVVGLPGKIIMTMAGAHEAGVPLHYALPAAAASLPFGLGINAALRNQPIAGRMIAAGLNPSGFQFTSPLLQTGLAAGRMPFSLTPPTGGQ